MKVRLAVACLSLLLACAPVCAAQEKGKEKGDDKQGSLTLRQMDEEERNREQLKRLKVEPGVGSLPPALAGAFRPVELPEGEGAWAVQVVTRGGFTGAGRGDLTVYSDGRVTCVRPTLAVCVEQDPAGGVAQLSRLVAKAEPARWRFAPTGSCSDCYLMLLVVQRREPGGKSKTYTAYWDGVSAATVSPEAKRIYEAALSLTTLDK